MTHGGIGVCAGTLLLAPLLGAQAGPAVPRPAHERLAVFEGVWNAPADPGTSDVETCAWLPAGRRHMVCTSRRETPTAVREQMIVYSYRGRDSTYLATVFLAGGQVWRYAGRPEGDRWVFQLLDRPDSAIRLRMVIVPTPDTIRYREEFQERDGSWRLSDPREDVRRARARP